MDAVALVLIAVLGLSAGAAGSLVWMSARGVRHRTEDRDPIADEHISVATLLGVLPGATVLVDGANQVVKRASARAISLGLVVSDRLASLEMQSLVGEVYRDGIARDRDITIRRPALSRSTLELRVRAAQVSDGDVLVLVEDLSGTRRIDTVRRDFVANVSHELKTPVGALTLLAEAVDEAADDPEAVRSFAARITQECARLTNLVGDLIDLSRLQGDQPLESATAVDVDAVVAEAVDSVRTVAAADEIEVAIGGERGLQVFGVEDQLITALRNLLANALAYSPARTKVAVGVMQRDGIVNISVSDQGVGIPANDLERIFERFYRVDPARSRITGGTGLGLAIVKHVCSNHGGDVTVWSVEGEGSTFTLRVPAYRGSQDHTAVREPVPGISLGE